MTFPNTRPTERSLLNWRAYPGLPLEPEEYELWEERLVPPADLALKDEPRGYDDFTLALDVSDLDSRLRKLPGKSRPRTPWSRRPTTPLAG